MELKYTEPTNDFSNGLVVLKTYHEDFLVRGVNLLALVNEINQIGMNEARANQCLAMYWHYHHANQLHHQDEEQALFPLLLGVSPLIDAMMEKLIADHEEIEKAWALLAEQLRQPDKMTDFDKLQDLAQEFEKLEREHIIREDDDFSPKVKAELTIEQMQQVGKKMFDLRGLSI